MKHLLLLVIVFSGCTPVATYPPVETDAGLIFSNASNEPVPTIFAEILLYTNNHFGGMDEIVFNLPEGVPAETYTIVAGKIPGSAPMSGVEQLSYHVVELRKRPFRAEADIIFPSASGAYSSATVYLSASLRTPWGVVRDRVWVVPVNEVPKPNFNQQKNRGTGTSGDELVP
jgi:hypothetical protein